MRQFFAPEPSRQAIPADFREKWPEVNEPVQLSEHTDCFGEMNAGLHELHRLVQSVQEEETRKYLLSQLLRIRSHLVTRLDEMCADMVLRDN